MQEILYSVIQEVLRLSRVRLALDPRQIICARACVFVRPKQIRGLSRLLDRRSDAEESAIEAV